MSSKDTYDALGRLFSLVGIAWDGVSDPTDRIDETAETIQQLYNQTTRTRLGRDQKRVLEWMRDDPAARNSFVNSEDSRQIRKLRYLGMLDENRRPTQLAISIIGGKVKEA